MSDPVQDFCVANEFVDCVSDLELLFGSELAVEAEDRWQCPLGVAQEGEAFSHGGPYYIVFRTFRSLL